MTDVHTIRGPVDSSTLGWTLSHEHLTAGAAGMQSFSWIYHEDDALKANLEALRRAREAGIESIIDLTPFDLGRQVSLFEKIAEADVGVNIICATGVYRWVPMYFARRSVDEIADHFIREFQGGIQGSSIRPGVIKVAWDQEYRLNDGPEGFTVRSGLERVARAVARSSKALGIPVSCHTLAADKIGIPLLDIFAAEGLNLRAVTIGHSNDSTDPAYLQRIAARGATVGLDRYNRLAGAEEMARRAGLALMLAQAGFAEQVALGHDNSPYFCFAPHRAETSAADCWLAVPQFEIPWLREHGATDDQIDAMCRGSIRSTFEAAANLTC